MLIINKYFNFLKLEFIYLMTIKNVIDQKNQI